MPPNEVITIWDEGQLKYGGEVVDLGDQQKTCGTLGVIVLYSPPPPTTGTLALHDISVTYQSLDDCCLDICRPHDMIIAVRLGDYALGRRRVNDRRHGKYKDDDRRGDYDMLESRYSRRLSPRKVIGSDPVVQRYGQSLKGEEQHVSGRRRTLSPRFVGWETYSGLSLAHCSRAILPVGCLRMNIGGCGRRRHRNCVTIFRSGQRWSGYHLPKGLNDPGIHLFGPCVCTDPTILASGRPSQYFVCAYPTILASLLPPTTMLPSTGSKKTKPPPIYSSEERAVLNIHKDEYRRATTSDARSQIFRSRVVVDIFKHWQSKGKAPQGEEETRAAVKVCGSHTHLMLAKERKDIE